MDNIIVMKFGGTSVADADRIKRAARRIVEKRQSGHSVVAVLSARGKTTDELIAMAAEVSDAPHPREMDMLLSTGERISCALCAMAINDMGHHVISLTGSQAGIVTDTSHTKAKILDVRADRIIRALDDERIVLVAGFQGVSTAKDVTTLGRGGSDTTAVAVAAALGAEECEIYTDVAGVFSADPADRPRRPHAAGRLLRGDARDGGFRGRRPPAPVGRVRPQPRRPDPLSIELRRRDQVPLSSQSRRPWRRPLVTAVTHSTGEARVTLLGVPDKPGTAGRIFGAMADANINVDMIIQNEPVTDGRRADMSFTVPAEDLREVRRALDELVGELGIEQVATDEAMGKVSIIGAGMRSHPGVAAKVFRVLGEAEINIEMIATSPIKISCVIHLDRIPEAVRALHSAFGLDASDGEREDPFGGPPV